MKKQQKNQLIPHSWYGSLWRNFFSKAMTARLLRYYVLFERIIRCFVRVLWIGCGCEKTMKMYNNGVVFQDMQIKYLMHALRIYWGYDQHKRF